MVTFVAGDVYLNSKTEYEATLTLTNIKELSQLQMILFGCSVLLQFSITSALFLILCNTFPFQVGLMFPFQEGIFKWLLVFQPIYMVLSCVVGGVRLVRFLFAIVLNFNWYQPAADPNSVLVLALLIFMQAPNSCE